MIRSFVDTQIQNIDDPSKIQQLVQTLDQIQRSLGPQKFAELTAGKSPRELLIDAIERRRSSGDGALPSRAPAPTHATGGGALTSTVAAAASATVATAMDTGGGGVLPTGSFAGHSMAMAGATVASSVPLAPGADRVRSPFDERKLSSSFRVRIVSRLFCKTCQCPAFKSLSVLKL